MEIGFRCDVCDASFTLQPKMDACPACRARLPIAISIKAPKPAVATPPSHRRAIPRRDLESSRTGSLADRITPGPALRRAMPVRESHKSAKQTDAISGVLEPLGAGWVLRTREGTTPVRPGGDIDPHLLEGRSLSYRLVAQVGSAPLAVPKETRALKQIRLMQSGPTQPQPRAEGGQRGRGIGPQQEGTSPLELLSDDAREQMSRVAYFASRKDDPAAWSALANGYRIKRLRLPIESAMASVGWEKIDALTRDYPGQWPAGLRSWLDRQREDQGRRRLTFKGPHRRAWANNDYGTVED